LKDLGLRLLGVAHERAPAFPCRYDVRRDRAIGTLLSNWKSPLGIDHVTVAQWPKHGAPLLEEALHSTLAELGLRATVANFSGKGSAKFLRSVGRAKTGGIVFSSSELASRLSFRAPTTMEDLLCRRRVAFLNGPVTMPFAHVPSAQVDLVIADWQWIAEQIANDLVSQNAFSLPGPTIFEAEAKLRVSLTDFAQVI
jgi:hypothetical protein